MSKIKVGIVGIGNMGYCHAKTIYGGAVDGMQLVAVCDIDKEKQRLAAEQFSDVTVYGDYDEMLENSDIDAVIIAAPHYFHPTMAISAFKKGLNVLTEKPAGVRVSDVRLMNAEADKSGKVFGIMWNQRTNSLFCKAKEIINSGMIGTKKRLVWIITNWYRSQYYYDSGSWRATWAGEGGGVMLNQAPHNLDILQWIFGMPQSVRANCNVAKYHNIEVEDDATVFLEYDNGASAVFITSTGEFPGTNRLEISGSKGKMVLENGKLTVTLTEKDERDFCFSEDRSFPKIETVTTVYEQQEQDEAHLMILRNFANAVLKGEKLIAPGYDGIKELTISNAAYLSSWKNEKVPIDFDENEFNSLLQKRIDNSQIKTSQSSGWKESNISRWQVNW